MLHPFGYEEYGAKTSSQLTSERKRHEKSELAAVREEFRISLVEERDAHEEEVEELKRLMESKMAEHRKKTGWKMVELQS